MTEYSPPSPCESCPEAIFALVRQESIERNKIDIEFTKRYIGQCTLKHVLNGRRAELKRRLSYAEAYSERLESLEPTPEAVRDCEGPFERSSKKDDHVWLESICGARPQEVINGMRTNNDRAIIENDVTPSDI